MNISKFIIIFLSVVLLCSCTVSGNVNDKDSGQDCISVSENAGETQNGSGENTDSENSGDTVVDSINFLEEITANRKTSISREYILIDGKVQTLTWRGEKTIEILKDLLYSTDSAISHLCGGYVFYEDGSVIALTSESDDYQKILTQWLEDINKTVGIRRLFGNYVYLSDGSIYNTSYPETPRLLEEPRLNSDGTVTCSAFPETAEWQNVVDMSCAYWDFTELKAVFGLTSSGEVLSAGVDFTAENIVKLEVYSFDSDPIVPVALTADGRLIFPDYLLEEPEPVDVGAPIDPLQPVSDGLSMYDVAHASMEFTDVEDFVLTCVNGVDGYIMIVKKTDGSLHVTKNNYYDTEYLIEQ